MIGAALVGEWFGHALAYFRAAGLPGLRAGLGGGIHDYMLPLAAVLLVGALAAATWLTSAWLALGRRLDASAVLFGRLRAGHRPGDDAPRAIREWTARVGRPSCPSPAARLVALAIVLAAVQCLLFVGQENLERVLQGAPASGVAPLLDGGGAAAWIQAAVAAVLSSVLTLAATMLRSRAQQVERLERVLRVLWQRRRVGAAVSPPRSSVALTPAVRLLGSALWQRPPPAFSGA